MTELRQSSDFDLFSDRKYTSAWLLDSGGYHCACFLVILNITLHRTVKMNPKSVAPEKGPSGRQHSTRLHVACLVPQHFCGIISRVALTITYFIRSD